jgi:hypothetical protein
MDSPPTSQLDLSQAQRALLSMLVLIRSTATDAIESDGDVVSYAALARMVHGYVRDYGTPEFYHALAQFLAHSLTGAPPDPSRWTPDPPHASDDFAD